MSDQVNQKDDCNCNEVIKAKLLERFKSSATDARDHSVSLDGYTVMMGKTKLYYRPTMQATMKAVFTLKNGSEKTKSSKHTVAASYCPFCGQKFGKD